jgi:hypothetical protein
MVLAISTEFGSVAMDADRLGERIARRDCASTTLLRG